MESSCFICSDPAAQGLSARSPSNSHQPARPRNEVAEVPADSAPEDIRLISREHNSAGRRWPIVGGSKMSGGFRAPSARECPKSPWAPELESEPVDWSHQRSALPLASGSVAAIRCVICSWSIRRSMRIAPDVQPSTGLPVSRREPSAARC
jgi:hypothetical protein